jgi:deoxyribodipyrimidine photo-lyase
MSREEQEAAGCVIGRDYPAPVVDHKVQRAKALRIYQQQQAPAAANDVAKGAGK